MSVKIRIELSNGKNVHCEVYEDIAPKTVENFLKLVDEKFYEGTVFHRIIANFMIQTGGYFLNGNNLEQKRANSIEGEFKSNGFKNKLKHTLGVLSMARTSDPNSASSQFFICVEDCSYLDGEYAAFGKVIDEESLQNVIEVSNVDTYNIGYGMTDFPVNPICINSITRE